MSFINDMNTDPNEYNIYEFVNQDKRIYVEYDTDNDDTGVFPIIESAYYLDDKGDKHDYELSGREMDCAYERILDEMQADPRDEPDYYYDMENA
jgi:hypothetical protein